MYTMVVFFLKEMCVKYTDIVSVIYLVSKRRGEEKQRHIGKAAHLNVNWGSKTDIPTIPTLYN